MAKLAFYKTNPKDGSAVTYSAVVDGLVTQGFFEQAELLEHLQEMGISGLSFSLWHGGIKIEGKNVKWNIKRSIRQ